ncbi:MAG: VanW family protein [Firmicutes bacterium]|nr:VanW family protein [Bacillota bacterium]
MGRTAILAAAFIFIGVLSAMVALLAAEKAYVRADVITPGVKVGGMPFGGLTAAEGMTKLRAYEKEVLSRPVRVECAGKCWRLPMEQVGAGLDTSVLEEALAVGHRGWLVHRYLERRRVARKGANLPIKFRVDRKRLQSLIGELTKELTVLPQNAGFTVLPDDTVVVISGREGRYVDPTPAYEQVLAILNRGADPVVRLKLKTLLPEHTTSEILSMGIDSRLGGFTTTFDPTKTNRVYNITVAAGALNGLLVRPGEVISFNKIVGPRSSEAGYKTAPTIINNEFVDALGGGVCQVSTTLYNAVLLAGLEIVERHNHSLPVAYVPAGRDATVVYGGADFRFKNNTGKYLYLRTIVGSNQLTIKIFGNKKFVRNVELRSWVTEVFKPKTIRREDPNLEVGKVVVKQKGVRGCYARAERLFKDGERIVSEELPPSFYHPLDEIIAVGTKVVPAVVAPPQPTEPVPWLPGSSGQVPSPGGPGQNAGPEESGVGAVYQESH